MIDLHLANFKASGAELVMGSGRFVGPKTIEVALSDPSVTVAARWTATATPASVASAPPWPADAATSKATATTAAKQ